MMPAPPASAPLPVLEVLDDVRGALARNACCLLSASTGAGKTTALPLALLQEPWLKGKRIVMLEPRRIAARRAAQYMAAQLGEEPGETIGYHIRNDRVASPRTRLLVVTEGILTRMIQARPDLDEIALCIFDEFHERSIHGDLALALSLEVREVLRQDLRLLVMSATLETEGLMSVLPDPVLVKSQGRAHPVSVEYRPIPSTAAASAGVFGREVSNVIREEMAKTTGDVLVFLPGAQEIRRTQEALNAWLPGSAYPRTLVAPLHGTLGSIDQDTAVAPSPPDRRKVVLATNIAETSLTIEGITVVIDTGLERLAYFNADTGLDQLDTVILSEQSAQQRRGRAGRTGPGRCVRLWNEARQLPPRRRPEILRSDLTQLVLELALWGTTDPETMAWIDPPPEPAVDASRSLLRLLGALDRDGRITPRGTELANVGLHPRLGHMLLAAVRLGHSREGALLAVMLERRVPLIKEARSTDLAREVDRLAASWTPGPLVDEAKLLLRRLPSAPGPIIERTPDPATGLLLAFAYPDRVGQLREGETRRYLLSCGKGARLSPEDDQAGTPYLVFPALDAKAPEARVFLSAAMAEEQLERHLPERIEIVPEILWNNRERRVVTRIAKRFGALMLSSEPFQNASREEIAHCLMEGIRSIGPDALPLDDACHSHLRRIAFLKGLADAFPGRFDDLQIPSSTVAELLDDLPSWLRPGIDGILSLAKLRTVPLLPLLAARLDHRARRLMEELAPASIIVPSGSKRAVDYTDPSTPVLKVRIQEVFGLTESPRIARDLVPLRLHLLSPAQRPLQITDDLAGFWEHGYPHIRKEMRGRYPKHYWPEDPRNAEPTARAKPRR